MKDIPIKARVYCEDGAAGVSTAVVINPVTNRITHVVVEEKATARAIERLVPVELIKSATATKIELRCTLAQLEEMQAFTELHYVQNEEAPLAYLQPYVTQLDSGYTPIEFECIPPGDMAVRRSAPVEASDGHIGTVSAFLLENDEGRISHLVLQRGRLGNKAELTLPVTAIDRVEDNAVYLKLSKEEIASLPVIPVKREWQGSGDVTLIVWSYPGADRAAHVLKDLKDLARESSFKLLNAATVIMDQRGKARVHEDEDMGTRRGALYGAVTGGLLGLLAGPAGAIIGAAAGAVTGGAAASWIDMGFDDDELKALKARLQPDSSAIVVLVANQWAESVTDLLRLHGGEQFKQTLTDDMVLTMIRQHEAAEGQAGTAAAAT